MNSPKQAHILIVDDDNRILKLLKKFLEQNNYLISTATSVKEAKEALQYFVYDLMILDVMLPDITGLEFAKSIKSSSLQIPIVMLTALSEADDRIKGLEAGANDYLSKPFEPRELLLRIQNLIQNSHQFKYQESIKHFGNCSYDFNIKKLFKNNRDIFLSLTEQKLLEILLENNNNIISREQIAEIMKVSSPRSVDVQIVRLRNKIEDNSKQPKYLKTIRNEGYALYT